MYTYISISQSGSAHADVQAQVPDTESHAGTSRSASVEESPAPFGMAGGRSQAGRGGRTLALST